MLGVADERQRAGADLGDGPSAGDASDQRGIAVGRAVGQDGGVVRPVEVDRAGVVGRLADADEVVEGLRPGDLEDGEEQLRRAEHPGIVRGVGRVAVDLVLDIDRRGGREAVVAGGRQRAAGDHRGAGIRVRPAEDHAAVAGLGEAEGVAAVADARAGEGRVDLDGERARAAHERRRAREHDATLAAAGRAHVVTVAIPRIGRVGPGVAEGDVAVDAESAVVGAGGGAGAGDVAGGGDEAAAAEDVVAAEAEVAAVEQGAAAVIVRRVVDVGVAAADRQAELAGAGEGVGDLTREAVGAGDGERGRRARGVGHGRARQGRDVAQRLVAAVQVERARHRIDVVFDLVGGEEAHGGAGRDGVDEAVLVRARVVELKQAAGDDPVGRVRIEDRAGEDDVARAGGERAVAAVTVDLARHRQRGAAGRIELDVAGGDGGHRGVLDRVAGDRPVGGRAELDGRAAVEGREITGRRREGRVETQVERAGESLGGALVAGGGGERAGADLVQAAGAQQVGRVGRVERIRVDDDLVARADRRKGGRRVGGDGDVAEGAAQEADAFRRGVGVVAAEQVGELIRRGDVEVGQAVAARAVRDLQGGRAAGDVAGPGVAKVGGQQAAEVDAAGEGVGRAEGDGAVGRVAADDDLGGRAAVGDDAGEGQATVAAAEAVNLAARR